MDTNLSEEELMAWEDADSTLLPPINERDAADPESVAIEERKRNPYDQVAEAYRRKAAYESSRPKVGDHKPNKWQRLAAAAANFGAGYVNAGGRTRVDQGAMNSLNDSLLRPGYTRAMQEWKDRGAGVDAQVEGARAQAQIESAQQRMETEQKRADAYAKSQEAIAAERRARMNRPQPRYINSAKGMFDNEAGKYVDGPPGPGKVTETPAEKTARLGKEAEEVMGYKPGTDEYRAYIGDKSALERIKAKNRPAKQGKGGGGAGKPRLGTPGQFRQVEKEKQAALAKAEAAYRKAANDSSLTPDDKAAALQELKAAKAEIMAAYDAGVETLGGSVVPRGANSDGSGEKEPPPLPDVKAPVLKGPQTGQNSLQPKQAMSGTGMAKIDEADVRKQAIAAGKDPDATVAYLKQRGLL